MQHPDGRLCFAHTGAHRAADSASRYFNRHLGANIYSTSYIHANRRSYSNPDTSSHAGGDQHAHLGQPGRMQAGGQVHF